MKHINRATACAAISGALLAMPAYAFAEESSNKADILIPKMAEFVPALIAFLIIWIVLAKFAWPQILAMMDERGKRIQESLDEAEATKQKAISSRKEYDELVTDARRKSADIILEARKDAEGERARIIEAAHKEAEDIIAKAHANAEAERNAIYAAATTSIADLSVSVASKIVGQTLSSDEEQRALIERYIKEAGSLNA